MTAILAPSIDHSSYSRSNGTGNLMDAFTTKKIPRFSSTSKKLDEIVISLVGSYSATSTSELENLEQKLSAIYFECSTVDWDGYDALPVSKQAFRNAKSFIGTLPKSYQKPVPVPESDGEISLEWNMDDKVLSLSFGDRSTISYAMRASSEHKMYGVLPYDKGIFSSSLEAVFQHYISA